MGCWLFLKCGLPGFCTREVCRWDGPFFCERMAEERDVLSVEEVEDTVVNVAFFRAEFINAILQIICVRTPEFMTFVF